MRKGTDRKLATHYIDTNGDSKEYPEPADFCPHGYALPEAEHPGAVGFEHCPHGCTETPPPHPVEIALMREAFDVEGFGNG